MYTTKRFHRHGSTKFVSVGDPYEKKLDPDSRTRGRQFQTRATPTHHHSDYFGRFSHPKGESFVDRQSYLQQQPREGRSLGFGSSDANKKGEFTISCRTAQWKEHLARERRLETLNRASAARDEATDNGSGSFDAADASLAQSKATDNQEFFQCRVPKLLYDIGRTKRGVTPRCSRCPRDTFYCRHRARTSARCELAKKESAVIGSELRISKSTPRLPQHAQPQPTASAPQEGTRGSGKPPEAAAAAASTTAGYGYGGVLLRKPEFGRRSAVRDFYDTNHLHCG